MLPNTESDKNKHNNQKDTKQNMNHRVMKWHWSASEPFLSASPLSHGDIHISQNQQKSRQTQDTMERGTL